MQTKKRAVIALFVLSFVLLLFNLSNSLVALIMSSYPDVNPTTVTSLLTIPSFVGIFVSFLIGPIALKVNKKYLLMFIGLCLVAYFTIFTIVGANGPFVLLLVAAGIVGVAQGGGFTMVIASIGEFVGPEKSANYIAIANALVSSGMVAVSLLGGAIAAGNNGANWPQAYYLGIIIIPALLLFAFMMPKKPDETPTAQDLQTEATSESISENNKIPLRAFVMMLVPIPFVFAVVSFMFYYSVYVIDTYQLGTSLQAGIVYSIFTFFGVAVGFSFPIWNKLFKNWIITIGCFLTAAGLSTMMLVNTTIIGAYVGAFLIGFGFTLINPSVMSRLMQVTPIRLIPITISINMGITYLCMSVSIYVLNFSSNLLGGGVSNVLLTGAIFAVVSMIASIPVFALKKLSKSLDETA